VSTIEHAMAALTGCGIDNVLIEIDGPEIPIMDGSAAPFVGAFKLAGIEAQDVDKDFFIVSEPISYKDEVTGTELMVLPCDHFEVTTMIDFSSPVLGQQYAALSDITKFEEEIAPCRTFVFLHELEKLLNMGLIKGGDMDNAIVIVDRVMDDVQLADLAKKLDKPSVKVEKEGILNTIALHFNNEPARHKLLDVIGDLTLVGAPIKGKVVATKPGHTSNVAFAKILKKIYRDQQKLRGVPKYDASQPPVYDIQTIMGKLQHRYPFLLVDKVIEITETKVVSVKQVTMNEEFFQGHFPGNPIMPGVLQIEALAQTGGLLALSLVSDPDNWDTYFLKIDNGKFRYKVVPGDTLVLKMELLSPIRRGLVHMQGTAYVGNRIVSEAELTAQIIKSRGND